MNLALEIVFMSVSGVFLAMAVLTVVLYLFRILSNLVFLSKKGKKPEFNPNEELILLITAATYMALRKSVKIHKVHIHREPYVERWSYAGRMDIHLSHQKSGVNQ